MMNKRRSLLYIVGFLLVLSSCATEVPIEKQIKPFSFTNQHGESFGTDELVGNIWIAQFIFTSCDTVCPRMAAEMAALQQRFEAENIEATFVSFSVDPEVDTPEALTQYIQQFTDDDTNWHLLTGYSQEDIETFAREQFQTIVQKPSTSTQVLHGTNFYLIDAQGFIRGEYHYIDQAYMNEIIEDIKTLK